MYYIKFKKGYKVYKLYIMLEAYFYVWIWRDLISETLK